MGGCAIEYSGVGKELSLIYSTPEILLPWDLLPWQIP